MTKLEKPGSHRELSPTRPDHRINCLSQWRHEKGRGAIVCPISMNEPAFVELGFTCSLNGD